MFERTDVTTQVTKDIYIHTDLVSRVWPHFSEQTWYLTDPGLSPPVRLSYGGNVWIPGSWSDA